MSNSNTLFEELLKKRGLTDAKARELFLEPDYDGANHDPWLLPDMRPAVDRLKKAQEKGERIVIYGDYDVDGLTATALLKDAFESFGINVSTFIPNRFIEGYGLSEKAIEQLAGDGYKLVVTVDCGSLSDKEIKKANSLKMDVIVTDHHTVAEVMPPAVAVINPKRLDHVYPFRDLAGVGVAFKLVRAMQSEMRGLEPGQEKWLLDLVALGTVCDVVGLVDENRANVFWGIQVLHKSRRVGLKALAEVTGLQLDKLNSGRLGFIIGPHLNASGRLKTAMLSLELLTTRDMRHAEEVANELHRSNRERQTMQKKIYKEATAQAADYEKDPVLLLSHSDWSHGIVGIVAANILEKTKKPTFVLQELGETAKGSARSFGDFSAVDAINSTMSLLEKGGGHKYAAGVTLKVGNIPAFRKALNDYYHSLKLHDQEQYLEPVIDLSCPTFDGLDMSFMEQLAHLEPFGHGNPQPIFKIDGVTIRSLRRVGSDGQHLKVSLLDSLGQPFDGIGFSMGESKARENDSISAVVHLMINEWMGRRKVEVQLLEIMPA
ncbi:MAG TPA: single-stranded-DNA-specific exonuclease RecJ [Candidatus Saccharimonadales bacterium]|nr:single-stranded-DNA-specific exonuclease RecJ [Candidatus Saccharimonadales bacterium]